MKQTWYSTDQISSIAKRFYGETKFGQVLIVSFQCFPLFGINLKRYRLNRERDTVPSFPRVSVSDFEQNMIEMIRLAREGGARVLFIEMPQNPLFEVDHKGQDPAYARALQRLLKLYIGAADVFYVDLRKFFQAPMRAANGGRAHTRYFVDDCHLTAHGHRLVAVHLASFLEKAGLLTDAR